MGTVNLEVKNNVLEVNGTIDFYNVVSLWQQGLVPINTLEKIKVDLKGLLNSDSSGLALFTAWVRAARAQNKEIVFINMPSFMQDISRVCGLDGVLPVLWEN